MEVLVGPTFTLNASSSPPAYATDHQECEKDDHAVPPCLFLNQFGGCPEEDGDSVESSSSIGTPDDSDEDLSSKRDGDVGEDDEVQSKLSGGVGLGSLDSLEDSLPIKRGLSSHFNGKSKSFTDLSQVSSVKELQKQENPFNKRKRVPMASKWSRKSGFYGWSNPKSMPLLPVDEDEDDYEEERGRKSSPSSLKEGKKQEDEVQLRQKRVPECYAAKLRLRLGSFKSRSFSQADLQEHDEEEEEEEEEDD